jgi:hypothetical protein
VGGEALWENERMNEKMKGDGEMKEWKWKETNEKIRRQVVLFECMLQLDFLVFLLFSFF